ncbi:hypothetical protein D3C81_2224140 [compost metagenome]
MQVVVVFSDPDNLVVHQLRLVAQRRGHTLDRELAGVLGQFLAVDQNAYFGVPQH